MEVVDLQNKKENGHFCDNPENGPGPILLCVDLCAANIALQ